MGTETPGSPTGDAGGDGSQADLDLAAPVRSGMSRGMIATLLGLMLAGIAFAVVTAVFASSSPTATSKGGGGGQSPYLVTYKIKGAEAAPPLHLPRLGGGPAVGLPGLGHRPIVVNFFASWCTACQSELRAVATVADQHRVTFVGVDTNETSQSAAQRMLARVHASYPVGVGGTSQASEYRAPGLPTTVFIDSRGRIVAMALGALTVSELERWVSELQHQGELRP